MSWLEQEERLLHPSADGAGELLHSCAKSRWGVLTSVFHRALNSTLPNEKNIAARAHVLLASADIIKINCC